MATCEDGIDYCLKHDENNVPIRATEWMCTWLARAAGIAVATPKIIVDMEKNLVFGSEIYGEDVNDNLGIFQKGGLSADHVEHIWKTFAFDLFVYNCDRHVNNYKIFRQNKRNRMLSFDFDQSLFRFWPNIQLPLPPASATMRSIRGIAAIYGKINLDAANAVLQRLEAIEGAAVVGEMKRLPRGWLDRKTATDFTVWFGGRHRRDRVAQIREGLRDGTYL